MASGAESLALGLNLGRGGQFVAGFVENLVASDQITLISAVNHGSEDEELRRLGRCICEGVGHRADAYDVAFCLATAG
jgi:hypothetical protein